MVGYVVRSRSVDALLLNLDKAFRNRPPYTGRCSCHCGKAQNCVEHNRIVHRGCDTNMILAQNIFLAIQNSDGPPRNV